MEAAMDQNEQSVMTPEQKTDRMLKIIERLATIEMTLNAVKSLYNEKDSLTLELKDLMGVGVELTHGDAIIKVVDNFAEKNTVFRTAGVKRFELEIDSVSARVEKLLKKEKKK